jgi:hypothetical protein
MNLVSDLKGMGYLTSTGSVALLGAVSWKSASQHPLTLTCLLLGMLLSVAGMMLRWRSHRLDQKKKDKRESGSASEPEQRADRMVEQNRAPLTRRDAAGARRSTAADS